MVSRDRGADILRQIVSGERSGTVLAVWEACRLRCRWQDGVVDASVAELAEMAGTVPNEVYRSYRRLVEIGALVRQGRGIYALNPEVARFGPVPSERRLSLVPAE